jgi:hypothetical protein
MTGQETTEQAPAARARKIALFGRHFHLPRSRLLRIAIGVGLIVLGIFGFLPVLGFWMIPLGLLILSYEFHVVRRLRRRLVIWWEKRKKRNGS